MKPPILEPKSHLMTARPGCLIASEDSDPNRRQAALPAPAETCLRPQQSRGLFVPPLRVSVWHVIVLLGLNGCDRTQPEVTPPPADAIAKVGSQVILQGELDHVRALSPDKSDAAILEEIARDEALAQLAQSEGLTLDPGVKQAIRSLLASRLREKHLRPWQPSEAQISEALARQEAALPPPKMERRLAFLRLSFDTVGSQETAVNRLKEAASSVPSIKSPGFGALAVTTSDDTDTRYQGGDAGWILEHGTHPLLPAAVNEAAAALTRPRQPSEVVIADGAAWLVMFWDTRQAPGPKKSTRAEMTVLLQHRHEKQEAEQLISQAKEKFPLTILQTDIDRAPKTSPAPVPPPLQTAP